MGHRLPRWYSSQDSPIIARRERSSRHAVPKPPRLGLVVGDDGRARVGHEEQLAEPRSVARRVPIGSLGSGWVQCPIFVAFTSADVFIGSPYRVSGKDR